MGVFLVVVVIVCVVVIVIAVAIYFVLFVLIVSSLAHTTNWWKWNLKRGSEQGKNTHTHTLSKRERCKQKRLRQPNMQIVIRNYVTNALSHTPYFLFATKAKHNSKRMVSDACIPCIVYPFAANWLMTLRHKWYQKMSLKINDCCYKVEWKPIITIHPIRGWNSSGDNSTHITSIQSVCCFSWDPLHCSLYFFVVHMLTNIKRSVSEYIYMLTYSKQFGILCAIACGEYNECHCNCWKRRLSKYKEFDLSRINGDDIEIYATLSQRTREEKEMVRTFHQKPFGFCRRYIDIYDNVHVHILPNGNHRE